MSKHIVAAKESLHLRRNLILTFTVFHIHGNECCPAVALAFEEMCTLYASEWEICVQKFGNAYQRNRETNGAFRAPLSNHSAKYWTVVSKLCTLSFHNTHVTSVIVDLMCGFERCWGWISLFMYDVRINSMILHTARFVCVLYTEICIHAIPGWPTELTSKYTYSCGFG